MLLDQSRPEMAEQELRMALADVPDDALAHALMARCLTAQKKYAEATEEAQLAVHLAPDEPYTHYCLSLVLEDRNYLPQAVAAVEEALRLDPHQADYYARLAGLQINQRKWAEALATAEQGLGIDPEHSACTNLKAVALVKLGRKDQAGRAVEAALERNPEDAYSHANMGWTLIEQGNHAAALEHFREALRLEPELEWAREGMVEALRARYFIYRIMLGWFLWMQKLGSTAQWGIIVGLYVANQVLHRMADANPALKPWIMPLLVAYGLFAFMTWISHPAFNLLLRLSRFGRMVLSREEIITSNWVGLLLLGVAVNLVAFLATGNWAFIWGALAFGLCVPAVSHVYHCEKGWPRVAMILIALAVFLCGAVTSAGFLALPFVAGELQPLLALLAVNGSYVFIFASVGSQFAAMALSQVRQKK